MCQCLLTDDRGMRGSPSRQKRVRALAAVRMPSRICGHLLLVRVIMSSMGYCDLCEMDREFCEHSLTEKGSAATAAAGELLISPNGHGPLPGMPAQGR
jgi:hypothetical protein